MEDAKRRVVVGSAGADEGAATVLSDGGLATGSVPEDVWLGSEPPLLSGDFARRYAEVDSALGAGGMGQVHLVRDERIGRRVAMKRMHQEVASALHGRFLREAKIQGQLEHPAVVPVYDLGLDPAGAPYFTMKRVRGRSLERILRDLATGDEGAAESFPRRRLLTAFATLCLALDFAHSRGVVHRDIKPANIMLGDFGEVYVLDWGIARMTAKAEPEAEHVDAPATEGTSVGALLGTPGYMAPEQVLDASAVDRTADVYALGAVLFEILALEPLHHLGSITEMLRATMTAVGEPPSGRELAVDVPPELDAACLRATAVDPLDRFASARELHDAVQRYLDGDRDIARRRAMADEHTQRALELVDRIEGARGDDARERAEAMRSIGSALALAPLGNPPAMAALGRLLACVPRALPEGARQRLELRMAEPFRRLLRASAAAYACWLGSMLWSIAMGVRDLLLVIAASAPIAAGMCWMLFQSRMKDPREGIAMQVALCFAAVSASSFVFGPLVLTPLLAVSNVAGFLLLGDRRHRGPILAAMVATFVVPAALEWAGVGAPRYAFTDGTMVILPTAVALPEVVTRLVLLTSALFTVAATAYFVLQFRNAQLEAAERLEMHMWHLERMFPAG